MVLLHFPGGGGGAGTNPYNYNFVIFQGGLDPLPPIPPSGSAHGQCSILARISSDEPVQPPFKLRNFKCLSVNSF